MQPIPADAAATFAAGLARFLNSEPVGDTPRLGSFSAFPGNFSAPLGGQSRKASFPLSHRGKFY
jgi:hypothetical protein